MSNSPSWICRECGQVNVSKHCIKCGAPRSNAASPGPSAAPRFGTKTCPACGETIRADARKCRFCGEYMISCPHCGRETAQGFRVCHHCKRSLGRQPAGGPSGRTPAPARPPVRTAPPRPVSPRSFVGPAFLTWILYYLGIYIVGFILNLAYLSSSAKVKRETGSSPSGRGCLLLLFFTHFVIPAMIICVFLALPVLGVGEYEDILQAIDEFVEEVVEMIDSGEFSLDVLLANLKDDSGDSGGRSSGRSEPTVDPWEEAVSEASRILRNAPDFEDNLQSYQTQAAEISRKIAAVEQASPLLRKVDELESTEIPFVGNAWEVAVELIDVASPGAGQALEALVELLREIEAFKQNLDQLQSLAPVVDASRSFRNKATERNLRDLDSAIAGAMRDLEQVDGDVASLDREVADILDSAALLQEGLREAASLADVPIVKDGVRFLNDAANDVLRPLRELHAMLEDWHRQMQGDLEVMGSIQRAVDRAER